MRRPSAAPSRFDTAGPATGEGTENACADEMSARVLGIIRTYRMGREVEPGNLCPKPVPEALPETEPPPRPAEGYIRNGVYHVAETAG